ncbi:MAG: hypothetical protein K8R85_16095 [Bacteroidetes bacterium]|nr:hypothetical protein [Bacteroidota bacterium]
MDKLLMDHQNTDDLAKAIAKSHHSNLKYAKEIAFLFKGSDDVESCKNIFNFIKKYVPYSIEPGEKQCIKTLPRMLDDARKKIGSDCKMYSVLTGTILKSLNIPFKYRLAGYTTDYPQHIYCVNDGCVIDAVLPFFNNEKKPYKYKQDMALYNLSGVDQIGKWEPRTKFGKFIKNEIDAALVGKDQAKEVVKGALDKVKMIGLAIPRNAFLLLVKINVRGLATRLQRLQAKNPAALENLWVKQLGGDITFLNQEIKEGAAKKPFLGSKVSGVDQIGVAGEEVAAIVAAASPVLVAIIALLAQNKTPDNDLPPFDVPPPDGDKVYGKGGDDNADRKLTDEEKDKIADKIVKEEFGDDKKTINPMILIGGAAAAIALFLLTKKK